MSTITEMKDTINTKTANLVLLTIATAGIYPIIWLFLNTQKLEEITSKKIADNTFLIALAVCIGIGGAFSNLGNQTLDIISGLLSIASAALYIIWSFKAKSALEEYALAEHKTDLRMNGFYTFFLSVYYINYCINDLPEAQRKQQILAGGQETTVES
ncbi:DUF4234 domain-containing protein [Shewanella sp.]|nr:DUF4234 domain-containing protein [Shewanella sp.]